jgi:hypothetical protein
MLARMSILLMPSRKEATGTAQRLSAASADRCGSEYQIGLYEKLTNSLADIYVQNAPLDRRESNTWTHVWRKL